MTTLRLARWGHMVAVAVLLLAIGDARSAQAQDYPNQTVKIVVPFVAGGGVDIVARIIAPRLSEELGQPVIIENRGGAGGMLGAAAVAQSPPDGYTLLLGTGSTHGTNSSVYSKLGYDPVRDFVPVVQITAQPLLLVVPPSLPAKSVAELIALARSKPGELSFGSYGTGSINHLGGRAVQRDGEDPGQPYSLSRLCAGSDRFDRRPAALRVRRHRDRRSAMSKPAPFGCWASPAPVARRSFRTSRRSRNRALPGFDTVVWFGLFAPAGTSKSVVDLVNRKANAVLACRAGEGKLRQARRRGGRRQPGRPRRNGCRPKCRSGPASCARRTSVSTSDRPRRRADERRAARGDQLMAASTSASKRQMHLGVFVLGTGNHSAGWRYEGAMTSSCSLPVMQSIAQIAERGKFDLFFISDGLAMDPGDHPSFIIAVRADDAARGAQHGDASHRARRDRLDQLQRAVPRRPRLRVARSSQRRPRRLERGDQHPQRGRAQLQPRAPARARPALRDRDRVRRRGARPLGLPGTTARSSPTRRPAPSSTSPRCGRSITRAASSRSEGRSTSSVARKAIRSSSRPAARRPGRSFRRARPTWCSRWSTATRRRPRPPTTA